MTNLCKGCFVNIYLTVECDYRKYNEECPCIECLVKVVCDDVNCQAFNDFKKRSDDIAFQRNQRSVDKWKEKNERYREEDDVWKRV